MEQLHLSTYFVISYDKGNEMFHYVFNEKTQSMTSQEYIDELQVFINLLKEYKPKRVLGEMVEFKFTITPAIQEWINNNLFPVYQAIGFKKIAILLSTGFFQSLSIQQTMSEENANAFQTAYFDDIHKAKEWLLT